MELEFRGIGAGSHQNQGALTSGGERIELVGGAIAAYPSIRAVPKNRDQMNMKNRSLMAIALLAIGVSCQLLGKKTESPPLSSPPYKMLWPNGLIVILENKSDCWDHMDACFEGIEPPAEAEIVDSQGMSMGHVATLGYIE